MNAILILLACKNLANTQDRSYFKAFEGVQPSHDLGEEALYRFILVLPAHDSVVLPAFLRLIQIIIVCFALIIPFHPRSQCETGSIQAVPIYR